MKPLLLLLLLALAGPAGAQCQRGDCQNGRGAYNFGFAVYEGEFKNGQPQGQGRLRYDDYTYEGPFADGAEDGTGVIIWKDGRREAATYHHGVRQADANPQVAAADYQTYRETPDRRCQSGNCVTGTGTFAFGSGNTYTGQFVSRQRHGTGTFRYANGDHYEGQWAHNDMQGQGSLYYAATGITFRGEFRDNAPYDGTYLAPGGRTVPLQQGRVVAPPPTYAAGVQAGSGPTCPECHGAGRYTTSEARHTTQTWRLPTERGHDPYYTASGTHDVLSFENVQHTCPRCHGTGHLAR